MQKEEDNKRGKETVGVVGLLTELLEVYNKKYIIKCGLISLIAISVLVVMYLN